MIEADRLLQGISKTLEQSVLPALGSGFARGQLFAVLDVLGAMSGQIDWGGMLLENEARTLAELIDEATPLCGPALQPRLLAYRELGAAPLAERLREGRAIVCALIEAGHADGGPLAASIDGFLANDTLFKAMALRPSRLAEISQG